MSMSRTCPWPLTARLLLAMLGLVLGSGPLPVPGADYYLSRNGDDTRPGNTPASAWRTLERVNRARFQPGDTVLLEGGATFPGTLILDAGDAGTPEAPVTLGSFGEGRAIVAAGTHTGIIVENAGGIVIADLVVVGSGRTNNTGHGVRCDNTGTNGVRLSHLTLTNLEIHGFGIFGILVSGDRAGFEKVRIRACRLHDNLRGGMEVAGRLAWDSPSYAHADVRVEHCQAHDNTGDPAYLKNHSGSGIVLYQVDGGVMEHCRAWNNGALCQAKGGGGVGLWVCASRRVVIQHCESFGNRTSGADGGGFDIDGGCEECVLQYNYSHDNDGPGLMVYSYPYASHRDRGNVVRFNVSAHDSRKGTRYAGLWVRTDGPSMSGVEIHNNTVLSGTWTEQAARFHGSGVEARVRNNLFIAAGSTWPVKVEAPSDRLRFEGNLYWCEDGPTRIGWGTNVYSSLPEWRLATGQELAVDSPTGVFADPRLLRLPGEEAQGGPRGVPSHRAFAPRPGSPVIGTGLDLRALFGVDPGPRDLSGSPLTLGRLPIGAIALPAPE